MTRRNASFIGFPAVLLWSLLALFTVGSAPVPPLQLNAMCFAIGGAIGVIWLIATGSLHQLRAVAWPVYVAGTAGLFGYHLLYFSALRLAPPAQAGLIAYLWPLLIVLFSGLLPGERLTFWHIAGALIAFMGAALILGGGIAADRSALPGYALAGLCALTWSSYSLLSRRLGHVPNGGCCDVLSGEIGIVGGGASGVGAHDLAAEHAGLGRSAGAGAWSGWIGVLHVGFGC